MLLPSSEPFANHNSVLGDTDTQRFDNAVRKIFTVSKEEMQRREALWQKAQGK
jgi:hypothetical protein